MLALDKRLAAVVICLAALAVSCGSADTGEKGQEFDDAVEALEQMGTLQYLIATPSDRECSVVASQDDDSLVPLTSVASSIGCVRGAGARQPGSVEVMELRCRSITLDQTARAPVF